MTRPGMGTGIARVSKVTRPTPLLLSDAADPFDEFHPSFFVHYAYNHGSIDNTWETDWQVGGLRYSLGLAGQYDLLPEVLRDFRARAAAEAMLKWRGLTLFGDVTLGFYANEDELSSAKLGLWGGSLTAGYLICSKVELALHYALAGTTAGRPASGCPKARRRFDRRGRAGFRGPGRPTKTVRQRRHPGQGPRAGAGRQLLSLG